MTFEPDGSATVKYSNWLATDSDTFPEPTVLTLPGKVAFVEKVATETVTPTTPNRERTIMYVDAAKLSQQVTVTTHYNLPTPETAKQSVQFYRTLTQSTANETGNTQWTLTPWTTEPSGISQSESDRQAIVPALTDLKTPAEHVANVVTTIDGVTTTGNADITVTGEMATVDRQVNYTRNVFTPDFPGDYDVKRTVTQTINYVDGLTKTPIAQPKTTTLTFTRTATVDDQHQVTYTDWQPETTATFAAVQSPTIEAFTTTTPTVEATPANVDEPAQTVTVYYYPTTVTITDNPIYQPVVS